MASVAFDDEGNVTDASGRALLDAINATARAAAAFDLEGRDRHLDRRDLLARDQSSRGSSSIADAIAESCASLDLVPAVLDEAKRLERDAVLKRQRATKVLDDAEGSRLERDAALDAVAPRVAALRQRSRVLDAAYEAFSDDANRALYDAPCVPNEIGCCATQLPGHAGARLTCPGASPA